VSGDDETTVVENRKLSQLPHVGQASERSCVQALRFGLGAGPGGAVSSGKHEGDEV
jgi:hypothetical protein